MVNFPQKMDLNALRADIKAEDEKTLFVLSETEEDILTEDLNELREINYHLVPVTKEWIQSRVIWSEEAKNQIKNAQEIENTVVDTLFKMDPNLLICLNRIFFIFDTENEAESEEVCEKAGIDIDIYPYVNENFIGLKWTFLNSIMIFLKPIQDTIDKMDVEDWEKETELEIGIVTTAIHEMYHLGLEANPFLPEKDYPQEMQTEEKVEQLAIQFFESI